MKTSHFSIIIISVFVIFLAFTTGAFAQNDTHSPLNDLGDGNPFLITVKGSFLPGQLVEINGNLVTVDPIHIVLDSPQGIVKVSTTTFSDRDGYFASELKIPVDAEAGNWTIVGISGIYHKELTFTILGNSDIITCYAGNLCSKPIANTTVQYGPKTTVSMGMKSPLEQFKSGIKPEYVKCASNLHFIVKAEDGSFACVSIETGKKLALRGWATTFGTGIIVNEYNISCNTAYPRSDSGIAVLYMPTNSVGKVCVRYHNLNNAPTIFGDRIFNANNITNNAFDVTTWASTNTLQGNDNATIVYSIKTGNKTGFYGLSLTCGGIPLAVGYDANSTITASDFPWANQVFQCGVITYDYYIEGTNGIGVRYIPNSLDLP